MFQVCLLLLASIFLLTAPLFPVSLLLVHVRDLPCMSAVTCNPSINTTPAFASDSSAINCPLSMSPGIPLFLTSRLLPIPLLCLRPCFCYLSMMFLLFLLLLTFLLLLVRAVTGMSAVAGVLSLTSTPAVASALLLLLVRDVPGMSAVAGVPSVASIPAVASVPAAVACP
jgi:hypothetical protein